jgi:hypothetical protein
MTETFIHSGPKIFCANPKCERRAMKVSRIGIEVIETCRGGTNPYKLWNTDILKCPTCGIEISVSGDGHMYDPQIKQVASDTLICTEYAGEEEKFLALYPRVEK